MKITKIRPITYDERTDIIEPLSPLTRESELGYINALSVKGYQAYPVVGWFGFTHRAHCDDFDWGGDFLVNLVEEKEG